MSSTSSGSFSVTSASSLALGDGSIVRRSTVRPSAFDTILLVITTTSLVCGSSPGCDRRPTTIAGRSSPGCTIGTPGTPTSETVGAAMVGM